MYKHMYTIHIYTQKYVINIFVFICCLLCTYLLDRALLAVGLVLAARMYTK